MSLAFDNVGWIIEAQFLRGRLTTFLKKENMFDKTQWQRFQVGSAPNNKESKNTIMEISEWVSFYFCALSLHCPNHVVMAGSRVQKVS